MRLTEIGDSERKRRSFELSEDLLEKSNIFFILFFERIAIKVYRLLQKSLQEPQNL
jgi:hypothetical protein